LLDSGAVSDRYVDGLSALAGELSGDASRLVEALERRDDPRTKGFFDRKTEELREYLVEGEYLPTREPLDQQAVRRRAMAAVPDALREGRLGQEWLDGMVARLFPEDR
jgi:hypothetical protein